VIGAFGLISNRALLTFVDGTSSGILLAPETSRSGLLACSPVSVGNAASSASPSTHGAWSSDGGGCVRVASLKLDADWVILLACNTAAGAATSAEALSGLARAFIYAQARALLVSHWEVYSDATVKLITAAIREMARDTKVGRAEAVRRSMLALIDKGGEPHEAHPASWAPFVVVGQGGSRARGGGGSAFSGDQTRSVTRSGRC
jgi:CHAT domain-containing protein